MESAFIGRTPELELFENLWESPKPALVILYGRRRVGKTRLLTHWLKRHKGEGLYWMAEATSALDQLRSFSQALADFENPELPPPLDFTFPNWEYALRKAALLAKERRVALFIDEVTYLMDVSPSIVGTLQKVWDHWLSKADILLALSGSQMGLMQKQLLSYDAPLYGRATAQIQLRPLTFGASESYFPDYSATERAMIYAIWGGIPAYWERLDPGLSIMENLRVQLRPSNSWMLDEPRLLLQDFINDPHNYVGIMRAISQGDHTFSGICERTGLSTGHTSRYLSLLRDTGFVQRRTPVSDNSPDSRRGRYFVTDPYLRFYYRFLAAYQSKLAMGQQDQMIATIDQQLPAFIQANTWPELCRQWLILASAQGEIPLPVEDVGADWKRTFMVDVVGLSEVENTLVLGVCVWGDGPADAGPIAELVERTRALIPDREGEWDVHYVGFSANGWTDDARADAMKLAKDGAPTARAKIRWKPTGVRLLDLAEVDRDLARWSV